MKKRVLESMGGFKHTENLTNNDENELWEKCIINKTTFKGVSMVCFLITRKYMGCTV